MPLLETVQYFTKLACVKRDYLRDNPLVFICIYRQRV